MAERLHFYLFYSQNNQIETPDLSYADHVHVIDSSFCEKNLTHGTEARTGDIEVDDAPRYGASLSLYFAWKNIESDYVGFSLDGSVPDIDRNEFEKLINDGTQIIIAKAVHTEDSLREIYRQKYYDFDFNVLRRYLSLKEQPLFNQSEEIMFDKEYYPPVAIMRKDIYRKFCVWLFRILAECDKDIETKKSCEQNKSLEHLSYYLINLYLRTQKKIKIFESWDTKNLLPADEKAYIHNSELSLKEETFKLIHDGLVEEAELNIENNKDDSAYDALKAVFNNYSRQRRHYGQTDIDINDDIDILIEKAKKKTPVIKGKPKMLILAWNSINNTDYIEAFEALGFDIDTMGANLSIYRRSDNVDRFNNFLDTHTYDVVFSINYFDYISEACYAHDIPYVAWAYDSPIGISAYPDSKYETTSIFLMDTDETDHYLARGYKNVFYLPLAVNIKKYDSIVCNKEDIEKYSSQISFVGRLYETKLTEYLNYLTDYKKGFFNAILDYNTGRYDAYASEDLFGVDLSEWLDEKAFRNAVFRGESKDEQDPLQSDDMRRQIVPRIGLLTNKTITNRERLIILSMLSNHWNLNLYSYTNHEVLKNVKECGSVDYYNEMPKVFKCSDINLNITFKSIKCGIPLRCLDIMGCGGLLLTNYQRDFDEHFKDGENIAIFKSLGEAYEKCDFYLNNEDERKRVALNGHDTVAKYFTYEHQIRKMFKLANLEYLLKK
ncbi:MAG: DUF4422 domain-containing protein [Lachnospiraceae bacterium]|jgi:spore maturation protein CgeB|nr:DUF4422 domain-containing protein [Lachnospiraceae bacterium]